VTTGLALALATTTVQAQERTYTDDLGVTHRTTLDKPKVVTFAHTAVSLFDYGFDVSQLIGYGEYVVTGSDYDFNNPEQTSSYNADPEPADLAKLQTVTNLSPGCAQKPGYCTEFNSTTLVDLDPDFLIVHGYAHNPWGFANFTQQVLSVFPQNKIIYNDISLEGSECDDHAN